MEATLARLTKIMILVHSSKEGRRLMILIDEAATEA